MAYNKYVDLRLTMTMASGMANRLALLLMASQVYAPESSGTALLIVRVPSPLLEVDRTRDPVGMLPQFNLHTIRGVGTPTASQMIVNEPPTSTSILGTGGFTIVGEAERLMWNIVVQENTDLYEINVKSIIRLEREREKWFI